LTSLAARTQRLLVAYYGLDPQPDVDEFVVTGQGRERLIIQPEHDAVALVLQLPVDSTGVRGPVDLDRLCQLIEGVSHFVLVAERARRELPTTALELELQAELDKFVVLSGAAADHGGDWPSARAMRRRLFDCVRFIHPQGTELGDRYRLAHRLALRMVKVFERKCVSVAQRTRMRRDLRRFYRLGQTGKLSYARAA
jgi:hypothetical protein